LAVAVPQALALAVLEATLYLTQLLHSVVVVVTMDHLLLEATVVLVVVAVKVKPVVVPLKEIQAVQQVTVMQVLLVLIQFHIVTVAAVVLELLAYQVLQLAQVEMA
jgi:hypothetical protein